MGVRTAVEQKGRREAPGETRHERLGGARAEFVAHLGRRAAELRAGLAMLEAKPSSPELRDELQRRLHALGAGARLLRFVKLADRVAEAEVVLEISSEGSLSGADMGALWEIVDQLPALAWGQAAANQGRGLAAVPVGADEAIGPRTARSATGCDEESSAPLIALVVGGASMAEALAPGIAEVGPVFEVERTEDATTAIDLARALAPDVVILDVDLPGARELVEALVGDPLTEPVPVLAVGHFSRPDEAAPFVALGVARALARPVSPDALRRAAAEAAATYGRGEVARSPLGELTLDQLGARLAEELHRGLCDAAEPRGRAAQVDMGEGAEVLAALWGAVARIRDLVTIRSQGSVRFSPSGPEGALPLAPWLGPADAAEALRAEGRRAAPAPAGEPALEGLGAVVADDDPAVTWFLAGVLRAAGATVHEAHDGARALDLAYQTTPDLVISDVLMPHLDGFALCRALKRDVVLRDVPVILLSWKEDLLQRLRELGADADGYLRKEASAAVIVQRIREVMRRPRRVAERVAAGGEVRGRLDGLTTRTLLSLACAHRPASIVSVRDSAFLYEVQIRDGRPAGATRTAPDGTFQRGPSVLAALLGVGSARFVVAPVPEGELHPPSRGGFDGTLAEQLLPAIAAARGAQRLLGGSSLIHVERVEIDEERMSVYAGATPEPARSLLRRLIGGASPRALITTGQVSARLVEDVLCDAAAHGSVTAVLDRAGGDLLAAAVASETDLLHGRKRAPAPAPSLEIAAEAREPEVISASEANVESEAIPLFTEPQPDPAPAPAPAPAPMPAAAAAPAPAPVAAPAAVAPPARPAIPAPAAVPVVDLPAPGPLMSLGSLTPPPVHEAPFVAAAAAKAEASAALRSEPIEESPAQRRIKRPSAYAPVPQPPAPPRESRATMWVLLAVAAFVFAVGARLSREREIRAGQPQIASLPPMPSVITEPPAAPAPPPPPPLGPVGESAANPVLPEDMPLPAGHTVPEGQGLLEVIAGASDEVFVDHRLVGTGTVKVTLAPKPDAFEIRVKLRGEERVRFARVLPGRMTRMRLSPPWRR
jgi:CheY-like chemotaxis protein